jgi:hypothetical protein
MGDSVYVLRESSSGLVFSVPPKTSRDGIPRHVTVAMDLETKEVRHVHMKSGWGSRPTEDWRLYPNTLLPGVASWIGSNSTPLSPSAVRDRDESSFCVSLRRGITTFRIIQPLVTSAFWTLGRGLGLFRFRVEEDERETRVWALIDPGQLLKYARRLRPLRRFIEAFIRIGFPKLLKELARLHLVRLADMSEGDVCLVLPRKQSEPTIVVKYQQHLSIPLEKALQAGFDWYSSHKMPEVMPVFDTSSGRPVFMQFSTRGTLSD